MPEAAFEVVCVGEAMVVLTPTDAAGLADAATLRASVGGAEASVALYLSGLGHHCAWVSRVGADPFGSRILAALSARGVDVGGVRVDPAAPTGVYFKDPSAAGTSVYYYRAGSAAARMRAADLASLPLSGARLLHLSGITPALSPECATMVDVLCERAVAAGVPVSFDVNYRPALWSASVAAPVLRELARRADVAFVGRDEALALWGVGAAATIRDFLDPSGLLVVKDGARGATEFDGGRETFESTPPVRVREPVGAGDAFAAGYLSAMLRGWAPARRLRLGHRLAARVLRSADDQAPIEPDERSALLAESERGDAQVPAPPTETRERG